nr:Chain A, Epstein-Barr nuclear antigen 1 [Human herpesvirus 4 strain B95-8]8DLF_B Chain B, Epstein-Barr nuclear antigen 1 [Human herpesvirus 4 strain B95-8]8DLF_C Chain C, Epstein-Barr nuclear antigen 1 [Human herpesvirus 4 strain B95-8]8DLF_D Chain D, Epstein-Barr nuclear antigen 1 [Human herpesvirus 4 strain B95-8]
RRKKGGWFGKHRGQGGSNPKFENIAEGLRALLARSHVERTTDEGTWVAGVFVYGGSKTSLYNLRRGTALAIPQCRLTPLSRLPFGMAPGPGPQPGPLRESIVCYFMVFLQTHIFAEVLKDAIKDLVMTKPAPTCNIRVTVCSFDDGVDLPPWFPPMVEGA